MYVYVSVCVCTKDKSKQDLWKREDDGQKPLSENVMYLVLSSKSGSQS